MTLYWILSTIWSAVSEQQEMISGPYIWVCTPVWVSNTHVCEYAYAIFIHFFYSKKEKKGENYIKTKTLKKWNAQKWVWGLNLRSRITWFHSAESTVYNQDHRSSGCEPLEAQEPRIKAAGRGMGADGWTGGYDRYWMETGWWWWWWWYSVTVQ